MRPIKFRVWDSERKHMLEQYEYNGDPFYLKCLTDPSCPGGHLTYFAKLYPENIMQFTGLLDKNGKEIYEGDIVREDDGVVLRGVVCWDRFMWNVDGFYNTSQDNPGEAFSEDAQFTVIGNIYENPELLNSNQ